MITRDEILSHEFGARCEDARIALGKHMAARGLRKEDGWRVHEFTRHVNGHTELVMRPVHTHLTAPDLECVCIIDEPGSNVSSECREE